MDTTLTKQWIDFLSEDGSIELSKFDDELHSPWGYDMPTPGDYCEVGITPETAKTWSKAGGFCITSMLELEAANVNIDRCSDEDVRLQDEDGEWYSPAYGYCEGSVSLAEVIELVGLKKPPDILVNVDFPDGIQISIAEIDLSKQRPEAFTGGEG